MRPSLIYDDPRDVCKILPVHQLPTPHAGYVFHRVGQRPAKISLLSVLILVNVRLLRDLVKLILVKPYSATTGAEIVILAVSGVRFEGNPASRTKGRKFLLKNVTDLPSAKRTYLDADIDIFAAAVALFGLIHILFHYIFS